MTDASSLISNYVDGIRQGIAQANPAPQAPAPTVVDQKAAQVQAAGAVKAAQLGISDDAAAQNAAVGNLTDKGGASAGELEADLRTLQPNQLVAKYGAARASQLISSVVQSGNEFTALGNGPERSGLSNAWDDLDSAGLGAFGLLNLATPVVGLVNKDAGVKMAGFFRDVDNAGHGLQSQQMQEHRQAVAMGQALDHRDTDAEFAHDDLPSAPLRHFGADAINGIKDTIADPMSLQDTVANTAGSLVGFGPLTKGVGLGAKALLGGDAALTAIRGAAALDEATGSLSAARLIAKAADSHLGTMAVTGATMAGGAYENTVNQVMDQLASRTDLTHDQKVDLANRAGLEAAAIQGTIATATGGIAAKFHENPLAMTGLDTAAADTAKSTAEMAIQGGAGQLAQNYAIKDQVDPNQDLMAGVGNAVGSSAVLGGLTGVALHAPGVVGQTAMDVAQLPGRLLRTGVDAFNARVDRINAETLAASPLAQDKVSADMSDAGQAVPEIQTAVANAPAPEATPVRQAPNAGRPLDAFDHMQAISRSMEQDPNDAQQIRPVSPAIADALDSAQGDRVQALHNVADIARNPEANRQDRVIAGHYLRDAMEQNRQVTETHVPGVLEHLGPDHELSPEVQKIGDTLSKVNQHLAADPGVQKAMDNSLKLAGRMQPETLSAEDVKTPEGQAAVNNALKLAEHAPEKLNPGLADQILSHASAGRIQLSDEQTGILKAAKAFSEANAAQIKAAQRAGIKTTALVSHEAQVGDANPGAKGPSAKQHLLAVMSAVKSGDHELAKDRLEQFMAFAQHFDNKAASLNESLKTGGSNQGTAVPFQARNPETGEWFQGSHWFNPKAEGSVKIAQAIGQDADVVTKLANSAAEAFPHLGVKPIEQTQLSDPKLLSESARDVAKRYRADTTQYPEAKPTAEQEPVGIARESSTELNSEPTGVAESSTEAEVSRTDPEQIPTAEATEAAPVEKTELENTYPKLLGSKPGEPSNWFVKAFRLASPEAKSRLVGMIEPIKDVFAALVDVGKFRQIAGDAQSHRLSGETSAAYQDYLALHAHQLQDAMNARLASFLAEKWSKGGTVGEALAKGAEINRLVEGKALNLTEVGDDGVVRYNEELHQSAMLAGLQWLLSSSGDPQRTLDNEDLADMIGKDVSEVSPDEINVLNQGRSREEAVQALASQIVRFWGVEADPTVAEGYTRGIAEAMAKEVLAGMHEIGLVGLPEVTVGEGDAKRTYARVTSRLDEKMEPKQVKALKRFPTAIEHLAQIDPEEIRYIGAPPKGEARTQLRNGAIKNTDQQIQVLKKVQNEEHYLNPHTTALAENLDEQGLLRLFGKGDPNTEGWNENYSKSVKGFNQTITGAFKALSDTLDELDGHGDRTLPMFFRYSFNRVNRLQMEGTYNPQASKLMREWILPTRSTLDLSDEEHLSRFQLAAAQAWGVKVHKLGIDASTTQAQALAEGKYKDAIDLLRQHLADPSKTLSDAQIDLLRSSFGSRDGGPPSPVALHAALEYARFLDAKDQGTHNQFTTHLYVEADGVTDGVVNALYHYTLGRFTGDWVSLMAKGGLFFDRDQTLAGHTANDKQDLYEATLTGFTTRMAALRRELAPDWKMKRQMDSMLQVMNRLLPGVNFDASAATDSQLLLERSVLKNPMTVTVYGSGADGIAAKITSEILDNYYELRSKNPEQAAQLEQALRQLTQYQTKSYEGKLYTKDMSKTARAGDYDTGEGKDYTLTPHQVENLTKNVRYLFVDPMREAIDEKMGGVTKATDLVRRSVQVMSIMQHYAFKAAYEARIADHKANDPAWKPGDGLSQREKEQALDSTSSLGPLVETGSQNIYPAGSGNSEVKGSELSRGLAEPRLSTPNRIYGPINAGVRGIAFMNIAPGDGQMIQHILTLPHGPKQGLPVFDGFHMKLDTLHQDAAAINEAVRLGWQQNPLEAMHASYAEFLQHAELKDLPKAQMDELKSALRAPLEHVDDISDEEAINRIQNLGKNLEWAKDNAADRHALLGETATSTDHMAGAESPHQSEGHDVSADRPDLVAQKLNALYDAKRAAREEAAKANSPETSAAAEPATAEEGVKSTGTEKLGTPDASTGARVVQVSGLAKLAAQLKLPEAHKPLVNELIQSLAKSGYQMVLGTPEQIQAWANENGKRLLGDSQVQGDVVHGYTVVGDKMIYLNNPSAETLVHEMIHAATVEKVFTYYDDPKSLTIQQQGAVKRLEALMMEWRRQGDDVSSLGSDAQAAHDDAKAAVDHWINNTEVPQNVAKANALNEFMAWHLANQHLIERTKGIRVDSTPLMRASNRAMRVLQAIKNLVWKNPDAVPRSMYRALRFNTSVLLETSPTVRAQFGDVMLFHSTAYGLDERLDYLRQAFQRHIVSVTRDLPNAVSEALSEHRVLTESLARATDVAKHFTDHGFNLTPQAFDTMLHMVGAFATHAQLDSNAMSRVHELYAHVVKTLEPEDFMTTDPQAGDQADADRAQRMLRGLLGSDLPLYDDPQHPQGKDGAAYRSALVPAFLALAATSDEFRAVLSKMPMPEGMKDASGNIDSWLINAANGSMEGLSKLMAGEGLQAHPSIGAAIDVLTNRIADSAQTARDYQMQNTNVVSRGIDRANDRLVDWIGQGTDKVIGAMNDLQAKTSSVLAQNALEVGKLVASMASDEHAGLAAEGVLSMLNRYNVFRPLTEIYTELLGRSDSNAGVVDLVKVTRTFVAKVRQQFREHLPELLASKFKELTDEDRTHQFKALAKTDLAVLVPTMGREAVLNLLTDPGRLSMLIAQHERMVSQLDPKHGELLLKKSAQLGRYLNSGEHGHNLLANAENIARLNGERTVAGRAKPSEHLVDAIDRLTTFYALDGLEAGTKERMGYLVRNERAGVGFLLDYLTGQRKDEQSKVQTDNARINHYKGYIPSENAEGKMLHVADDRDYAKLVSRGYRRVADYQGSRNELGKPSRGYYFSDLGETIFDQGIMQNARATASGVDPTTGRTSLRHNTAGVITDAKTVREISKGFDRADKGAEPLRAIYDANGKAVAYERMIDPSQQLRLERSTDVTKMIGAWRGRQAEEAMSSVYNGQLIQALHDMWIKEGVQGGRADEYVNLLETHKLDPVTRDAVSLFTPETLAQIQKTFGQDGFMVRKDLQNDAIGYRQMSAGDSWTGNSRFSQETQDAIKHLATGVFGAEAYRRVMQAEKFLQTAVGKAKEQIVVKSLIVPVVNTIADMYQLSARGVPLKAILHGYPAKAAEVAGYAARLLRTTDLEAELRASTNDIKATRRIQLELQAIQDTDRGMSIWPLIQAGEFDQIAEGLSHEDQHLLKGQWKEHFDRLVDGMPDSMKTAGRYALVTKDTPLYQGLYKAISYSDFLAKAVLYEDLTKRKGMGSQEALGTVSEEFVNYDRLAGRTRGYGESMGMTWFWNYKVRAAKIAISMMRNNPLQTLLTGLVPQMPLIGTVGSPMADNIVSMTADHLRILHSVGPAMGFHAIGMNPWLNLTHTIAAGGSH